MGKKLVIVESPAKVNTIKKILGKNYEVAASYGHVRDLPKSKIGVDVENNFEPSYNTIKGKGEVLKKLRALAKKADKVYLASDPDREGEAIAWHVYNSLKLTDENVRIDFNEITKTAIKEAVKHPKPIDYDMVNAQQARRILDRLVGYTISPLLWKIIDSNTSAGRVQSVALKLICDLEDEIKKFIVEKYWEVSGIFKENFNLKLYKIENKKVDRIMDKTVVDTLLKKVENKTFEIIKVKESAKTKKPPAPLKTSTLQQLASSYLGYSASKTMRVAQSLYEGIKIGSAEVGLITYMRTDSLRISDDAKESAIKYIENIFGKEYVGDYKEPKSKKGKIQDAHEAIRPTDVLRIPGEIKGNLSSDQYKLYKLIWDRFLVSQFSKMKYDQFELVSEYEEYQFRGVITKVTFDGYYKVFKEEEEINTAEFPKFTEGESLKLSKINVKEGETKPPARLNEASLVKRLESEGIGRPSTYAAIIETLKKREYVNVEKRVFFPTELGYEVKNELEKYFPNIMNIKFTASLEDKLDEIGDGKTNWKDVLKEFYTDLEKYLKVFEKEVEKITNRRIESDMKCPLCGKVMLLKTGRFGKFLECEDYGDDKCKGRQTLKGVDIPRKDIEEGKIVVKEQIEKQNKGKEGQATDVKCKVCGKDMVFKIGRFGPYLECSDYPNCKERMSMIKRLKDAMQEVDNIIILNDEVLKIEEEKKQILDKAGKCEKCGSDFIVKNGRFGPFLACSNYPECKNIVKIAKKKKEEEK